MTGILLDLIVAVVVIMLLLFGIWRGAYKLIFGMISSLLAVVLAVVLATSATQLVIDNTTIDDRIQNAVDAQISSKVPNANVLIRFYDLYGDGAADELGFELDGEVKPFTEILSGTAFSIFASPAEILIKSRIEAGGEAVFAGVLVATVVGYIMVGITFVALIIIFSILVKALMYLLKKFINRTYFGHFVDKFLGAALGLALAAVLVFGALAIVKLLATYAFIIPANALIESSTVTKWLFENNYLYTLLVSSLNAQAVIDGILSKILSLGGGA